MSSEREIEAEKVAVRRWLALLSRSEVVLSVLVAVGVIAGTLLTATPRADRPHPERPLDAAGGLLVVSAVVLVLALRRRFPVPALVAAMAAVNGYLLIGYPYGPFQLCIVVAMYEVARRRPLRVSLLICGVAAVLTSATVYARLSRDVDIPWVLAVAWTSWLIVPWSVGALVHAVLLNRDRSRRHLLARGALEERVKIASEVHDVAGHGFALVAMQARAALLVFDEDLEQVRRSLEAIRTTSTKSLTALRGMLDMLHPADQSPVSLGAENPPFEGSDRIGLSGLIDLVEQVRAGGLPVRLDMTGLQCSPAPNADAAAYRLVQEALTNVLRHAGATVAEVTIVQQEHEFVVRVCDRGRCGPGPATEGRGLSGMRRRVLAAGGSFQAGPRDGGGFHVEARLPMRAALH